HALLTLQLHAETENTRRRVAGDRPSGDELFNGDLKAGTLRHTGSDGSPNALLAGQEQCAGQVLRAVPPPKGRILRGLRVAAHDLGAAVEDDDDDRSAAPRRRPMP